MMADFFFLTFVPLLVAVLSASCCALVGNFLVLRRQALVGDAISHVVLPGIVVGFLVSGTMNAWPMLLGAAAAALLSVMLIEFVRRAGAVEPGAAMGTVFTAMFAAGVLLIEQSDTSGVHLDVEHALYGSLESLIWFSGTGPGALLDLAALADIPPQLPRLVAMLAMTVLFIFVFWRSLVVSTFDPAYARVVGAWPRLTAVLLVAVTAAVAVTAFDAVGSIIVIAMFICPPAAARLITDTMAGQMVWSIVLAVLAAVCGYLLAAEAPLALGWGASVSAAGMIATVGGLFLMAAALWGPRRRRDQSPA